jgi:hypothetical protein
MKRKIFISIFILSLIFSCTSKKEPQKNKTDLNLTIRKEKTLKIDNFLNSIKIDTALIKRIAFDRLVISNSEKSDSIISLCHCKKDKKNNIIKIQLSTAIPTQRELDTMNDSFRKRNRFLYLGDLSNSKTINGQFKFITIILKDSIVKSIDLYSKSTEKEYNGIDFDSLSIDRYKINISKFNYSIASDVYGNFEFRLKKQFGFFKNDTILKGNFVCNNWIITEKKEIKNWNIKKSFENRNNDRGFRIIE